MFDSGAYGPVFAELLQEKRLMPLGPGTPNQNTRSKLEALRTEEAFGNKIKDRGMAEACLAALWLYHDFLDQSHTISQAIDTATGGYWHGIMHRREPDYGNAKYWFRKVGRHPIFKALAAAASQMVSTNRDPATTFLSASDWDPFAYVDLCEASLAGRVPCEMLCREIQLREWELLFDFCYRQAVE